MKPCDEVQRCVEEAGRAKVARPAGTVFLLAVFAGLFVSLGASFMLLVRCDAELTFGMIQIGGGLAFCLGLFLVLTCGAELFTGNSLMVGGALSGAYGWRDVARNWAIVYAGNAVGALVAVALLLAAGFLEIGSGTMGLTALGVAAGKAALDPLTAFARGILCNVLVCLAVWVGFAGSTVTDKLVAALLPVTAFAALGFEHSVANMYFLPMGLAAQALGYADGLVLMDAAGVASNLLFVTLGNIVGGAVLVGCGYWLAFGRRREARSDS